MLTLTGGLKCLSPFISLVEVRVVSKVVSVIPVPVYIVSILVGVSGVSVMIRILWWICRFDSYICRDIPVSLNLIWPD